MNVTTENYISKAKDLILDEDLDSLEDLWNTISQVIRDRSLSISSSETVISFLSIKRK